MKLELTYYGEDPEGQQAQIDADFQRYGFSTVELCSRYGFIRVPPRQPIRTRLGMLIVRFGQWVGG